MDRSAPRKEHQLACLNQMIDLTGIHGAHCARQSPAQHICEPAAVKKNLVPDVRRSTGRFIAARIVWLPGFPEILLFPRQREEQNGRQPTQHQDRKKREPEIDSVKRSGNQRA